MTVRVEKIDSAEPTERVSRLPVRWIAGVIAKGDPEFLESLNRSKKRRSRDTKSNVMWISHRCLEPRKRSLTDAQVEHVAIWPVGRRLSFAQNLAQVQKTTLLGLPLECPRDRRSPS